MPKITYDFLRNILFSQEPRKRFGFFVYRNPVRTCLKSIGKEKSGETELDEKDLKLILESLKTFMRESHSLRDIRKGDNLIVHELMCRILLAYELGDLDISNSYKKVLDEYFLKLHTDINNLPKNLSELEKPSPLNIWIQHVIENPTLYVIRYDWGSQGRDYSMPQLHLSECGCIDLSHDRLFNNVRLSAEKIIIDSCKKTLATHPGESIKLLSLGSGEGLQDFILVLKLFNLGMRNLELTLVEKSYEPLLDEPNTKSIKIWQKDWEPGITIPESYLKSNESEIYTIIRALSLLSRAYPDTQLKISLYSSVDSLEKEKGNSGPFNVAYAIDFDTYHTDTEENKKYGYNDFHKLANHLSEEGDAILSHHYTLEHFKVHKKEKGNQFTQVSEIEIERLKPTSHSGKGFFSHAAHLKIKNRP